MRRLVPILALLLIWPLAASAQMVSPGGGNINGAITGGNCVPPEVMGGITAIGAPVCVPAGGGAGVPPGNAPQVVGYSAANVGEAETVSGDLTFTRAGANSYVATVLRLNGATPGGACTGNEFVNAISASGIPQCAVPVGGGGGVPLPVPTQPGEVLGTNGTDAEWSIVSGGPGNCGFTRTALGAYTLTCTDYATLNNPNFTGALTINGTPLGGQCGAGEYVTLISAAGVPTCSPLPAPAPGSILDTMLADAYSGVGNCTAGEYVTGLNRAAIPTCAPAATGNFAPLVNPTNGQNNYAPLAGPTFSGVPTMPVLQLSSTNISSVLFPPAATPQGAITVGTTIGVTVSQGARYGAGAWTAMNTTATSVGLQGGNISFFSDSGLPILGNFTPTLIGRIGPGGTNLPGPVSFGGVPMGGACPANQFVNVISATGVPTCAAVAAGGGVTVAATPPANPTIGMLWFDTVSVQLFIWYSDGTTSQWVPTINAATGAAPVPPPPVTVSATAPVAPVNGSLWFDIVNVQMFVWYSNGTSSQWAPVTHP